MAHSRAGVSRLFLDGQLAWIKHYGNGTRRLRLGALDWVVRRLGVLPLRPPPHHAGDAARRTEQRRLQELASSRVNVPRVLGEGNSFLVLSDMGDTLSSLLKKADVAEAERLLAAAVRAIAEVHRAGLYLGQPLARNITIDGQGRVGFLDFEEDPGEVMSIVQAQARDWLVFSAGTARHVPFDETRLAVLIGEVMADEPEELRGLLNASVDRLGFLRPLTARLGHRAAGIGKALRSLQRALAGWGGIVLVLGLWLDLAHDGQLEVVELIGGLFD
ncbi:BUD32 family EKC/KEOPS complex subunit [Marilutibacter alkalisoli]|uniref:Serine/threonine protein phosphatase n=1 Tax=Marilutibacter alkalisoli TaxID=2591633 RepID=A0A514BT02_9GAMM|nr:phosphotransferase [Lysobacter alkalisoli]QDH70518.1 serine/threonine protein phosphatase [Lysobacter alkalisoli]